MSCGALTELAKFMLTKFSFVGVPLSERHLRGTTNIKQLDDEEQESMRVVCKVCTERITQVCKICTQVKESC